MELHIHSQTQYYTTQPRQITPHISLSWANYGLHLVGLYAQEINVGTVVMRSSLSGCSIAMTAAKYKSEFELIKISLLWRHNGRGSVSNHQPRDCLLNRLFRRRSKKTSKLRVTGLCVGNSPGTGEFPAQMASNAENVSIWWRHHVISRPHVRAMGACYEDFGENWPSYNGAALYRDLRQSLLSLTAKRTVSAFLSQEITIVTSP